MPSDDRRCGRGLHTAYALIISDRFNKTLVALVGAALMSCCR